MEFEFETKMVNFEDVHTGDVLITNNHQTFLVVIDEDGYYRFVNLTGNAICTQCFNDVFNLCEHINDHSRIIEHIPSNKLCLSILEGKDEK